MNVRTYKKKPVVVEAVRLTEANIASVAGWCAGRIVNRKGLHIVIPTLEGDMRASLGDYVIKGVRGEFYPCKEDIFEETYCYADHGPSPKPKTLAEVFWG